MEKQFEIKRVSFNLTIDGKGYPVTKPNMKMLKEFTAKQKELEKSDDSQEKLIDESMKFLTELGLPEKLVDTLDPQMLEEITQIVTGQKKS